MKRILITGENSYIGTSFEKWVMRFPDEYSVDTVSTLTDDWRECDFSKYDVVFNVAGIAHVDAKASIEGLYYKVNRDLCIEIAQKSKSEGVGQFVFMSSMIVFSNLTPLITNETEPNPRNFYGNSKLQADNEIQKLNSDTFKVVSIRPPMVYGPNCKGNFQRLYDFATSFPIFPDYTNQRSMIYIDNLCEFIKLIIDNNEHGIFYPQNREYVNVSEAVRLIAAINQKKPIMTKMFNKIIRLLLHRVNILNKVFGSYVYDKSMSNYHNFDYCVVDFKESIERIKEGKK
ncbi:MAG: NAD dependent epimerase/dehydratase family protein [Firmicutes bacterium ADurb.Bin193]|nr:MAG: NAD dependent epimerase/dehydratase family protein [Firmicutes bacterium ADurb.Bin193]